MLAQEVQVPTGVSVDQAGDIAGKNAIWIGIGSMAVFFLVYRFLIK